MMRAYEWLTRCQIELQGCDIKEIDRLQLEMNLIRAKILMLKTEGSGTRISSIKNTERARHIYDGIRHLCDSKGDPAKAFQIMADLQIFLAEMNDTMM